MKRILRVVVGLMVVASVVTVAAAQGATRQSLNGTVKLAELSRTGSPPISGASVQAGTFSGAIGRGAITGRTEYAAPNFTARLRSYNTKGSIVATTTGSGTLNPDGSTSFSGTGKVISGTGRYRGARGSFTFAGTQPKGSTVATFTTKGSFRY